MHTSAPPQLWLCGRGFILMMKGWHVHLLLAITECALPLMLG